MKGIELPINVLVIVAVAVIVLLGIVALFMLGFSPFGTISGQESYKNAACTELTRGGCTDNPNEIQVNFDANKDDVVCTQSSADYSATTGKCGTAPIDTLQDLCTNFYRAPTQTECKRLCACPGY